MGFDDVMEGVIDVLCHAFGIAADVEVRAFLQPLPEFAGGLEHAGLNVDLFLLIAAEGGVEAGEVAALHPGDDLIVVEEVAAAFLITEEEPILAGGLRGLTFFEEGAKRGDTGAGADHDDGLCEVGGQAEVVRGVEVDAGGLAEWQTVREEGAGDAFVRDAIAVVAHRTDAEMHFVRVRFDAGRDGIETRLQLPQVFEEGVECEAGFRRFAEEAADFVIGEECFSECFGADLSVWIKTVRRYDGIDDLGAVLDEDAECVSDFVGQTAACE